MYVTYSPGVLNHLRLKIHRQLWRHTRGHGALRILHRRHHVNLFDTARHHAKYESDGRG
jgi:hypothetical protein